MISRWVAGLLLALVVVFAVLRPATAAEPTQPRRDALGDPLPPGALARLGTVRFRIEGFSPSAALSPDGKLVALAVQNNHVCLLDTATGKEVRRFQSQLVGYGGLAFSPDGKHLAVGSLQGIQLHDALTGAVVAQLEKTGRGQGSSVAFSGDGKFLAIGADGFQEALTARVWDVAAKKIIGTFAAVHNHNLNVALSADGQRLATWGQHLNRGGNQQNLAQVIQVWDVVAGKEEKKLQVEGQGVSAAAFAPDGKQLAVAESNAVLSIWDLATGKQVRRSAVRRNTQLLRYSPDGKILAGGTSDGAVQLWEADTGKRLALHACVRTGAEGGQGSLTSLTFVAPNKVLAAGVNGHAVCVWEAPGGANRSPREAHPNPVTGLAFRPDGKELLSAGTDGIRTWETATGKALRHQTVRMDENQVRMGMAGMGMFHDLSPDGKYLVCGTPHMQGLQVRELATGEALCDLDGQNDLHRGTGRVFAADGTTFATLGAVFTPQGRTQAVRVWDLGTGQQKRSFEAAAGDISNSLALSADGRLVAAATTSFNRGGADGVAAAVSVWDVAGGKQVGKLTVPQGNNVVLAFSPDGAMLATGSQGNQAVRLWDPAASVELRAVEGENNQNVSGLLFSPDGRTLAVASMTYNGPKSESKVQMVERVSGKVRATFTGHRGSITALAFAPDGRTLATGSDDTSVLLWDLAGRLDETQARGKPAAEELEALWKELDHPDASKGHRAMLRLTGAPQEALTLLGKRMTPAAGSKLEAGDMERLVADLDSDVFEKREHASEALATAGKQARPLLLKALEAKPSAEKKRRVEDLLEALARTGVTPEMVRQTRALEVLERLGTPEARELLHKLAGGNANASLTVEAQDTLRRLERQHRP